MRKDRSKIPPRASSAASENRIMVIKQKVSDIAGTMKSSSKLSGSSSLSETWGKEENNDDSKLDALFHSYKLENYLQVFKENKISIKDLNLITKEDLIDMKIPIGPRNRILKIIENFDSNQERVESASLHKKDEIKESVEKFMAEVLDLSRRKTSSSIHSYREESEFKPEPSKDLFEEIKYVLKEINDKQKKMMSLLKENNREIESINQFTRSFKKY